MEYSSRNQGSYSKRGWKILALHTLRILVHFEHVGEIEVWFLRFDRVLMVYAWIFLGLFAFYLQNPRDFSKPMVLGGKACGKKITRNVNTLAICGNKSEQL